MLAQDAAPHDPTVTDDLDVCRPDVGLQTDELRVILLDCEERLTDIVQIVGVPDVLDVLELRDERAGRERGAGRGVDEDAVDGIAHSVKAGYHVSTRDDVFVVFE